MAQKKNSKTEAPKIETKKLSRRQEQKVENRVKNEMQHQKNLQFLQQNLIQPEETVKEIHTYRKKGKKVIEDTRTVVKQKRPSQLIRKHIRGLIRDEEGRIIAHLEQALNMVQKADA